MTAPRLTITRRITSLLEVVVDGEVVSTHATDHRAIQSAVNLIQAGTPPAAVHVRQSLEYSFGGTLQAAHPELPTPTPSPPPPPVTGRLSDPAAPLLDVVSGDVATGPVVGALVDSSSALLDVVSGEVDRAPTPDREQVPGASVVAPDSIRLFPRAPRVKALGDWNSLVVVYRDSTDWTRRWAPVTLPDGRVGVWEVDGIWEAEAPPGGASVTLNPAGAFRWTGEDTAVRWDLSVPEGIVPGDGPWDFHLDATPTIELPGWDEESIRGPHVMGRITAVQSGTEVEG